MTNKPPQQRYEIGIVGLGVMGRNLVLNMADHGCAVAGYDKDQTKVEALRKESAERNIRGVPHQSFPPEASLDWQPSPLAMSIHPDEGIVLRLQAKYPGLMMHLRLVEMKFNYRDTFATRSPDAYEILFWDVMKNDATLFMRADKNIDELLEDLNGIFHRLRQSGIDEELFYVISGFEALSVEEK
jgi:hypothetical protein